MLHYIPARPTVYNKWTAKRQIVEEFILFQNVKFIGTPTKNYWTIHYLHFFTMTTMISVLTLSHSRKPECNLPNEATLWAEVSTMDNNNRSIMKITQPSPLRSILLLTHNTIVIDFSPQPLNRSVMSFMTHVFKRFFHHWFLTYF